MRNKFDALGVHCLFLLAMHLARRVKTSALLTSDILNVRICEWGVRVELRALCVPRGAPQPLRK